ncbi:MAG TPA: PfkB family carbohydrate kinase [Vicinamibacteria bacterium]|nr:PfkB family carbohydrate kinase [Vicinamibacteria bacterium]
MPRLLAIGHVTFDRRDASEVLGGSVSYGSITARRLGWEAGVLTAAGPDFDPARDLPGVSAFVHRSSATTRFLNLYDAAGERRQIVEARADDIELLPLAESWRAPDALLLSPVTGEIVGPLAPAFEASVVGAIAQGWLRAFDAEGNVSAQGWADPGRALLGVHVLFLSEHDLPDGQDPHSFLPYVPIVAVTRGWRGVSLLSRDGEIAVPGFPRPEVDPTGAGDVFAAAFLVGYHERGDPEAAAVFACCAASCAVEGVGTSSLGDRAEVERRVSVRETQLEEGGWDE